MYIDITTDCGVTFKTSPIVYVTLDSNPASTPSFTTATLGTNSNMASSLLSFGTTLSSGTHTIAITIPYNQINQLLLHGYKCLASIMFDSLYPVARQFIITDNGSYYYGIVSVTL